MNQFVELDENIRKAFNHLVQIQDKVKGTFDKKAHPRILQKGDLVLMWDKRKKKPGKHDKFDNLWLGRYKIEDAADTNSFYLNHLDGEMLQLPMNGKILKHYNSDGN